MMTGGNGGARAWKMERICGGMEKTWMAREYSLLQLPFSPATNADEATKTAAHFLAYHRRIAESLTTDELRDDNPRLERMQWISLIGDQGWHVSREWLRQGTSGLTTLIIRHCSQKSRLFAKLDHFLAKLPCLCVLDLSYTPLESLHPYICYLQKLHLLSLRGCYNLTSPFSFPNTEATLSKNNSNKKINLLYLDLSYSNITAFQCDFFHSMPNLQELMLVKCSNLTELPASTVALSSLATLELTGTQIKSFHWEGLNSLRSLKLIDNRKLLSLIGSMSKARGFIDQHTEGWESSVEEAITLEGHPTLRSFSLIDTPLVRRISLHRCRKLEFVDIKEVGALEELDLSSTAIKDLPADIPNLPKLGKLLIMDVPSLRRFPWHELRRLPDVFCLAQCYRHGNQSNLPVDLNPQVAQVCISDSRLFHSFRRYNPSKKVFKSFYVRVTPCKTRITKMIDKEDMVTTNKLKVLVSAYADVSCHYLSFVPLDVKSPFQETDRHVEISAVDRYPEGLKNLLEVTKSISLMYDTQVSCLNDLASLFEELEECKLLRCHRMVHVFQGRYGAGSLKNACVSHLKSLTHFYRLPAGAIIYDFGALKHLRLEHCPRLEGVMLRDSALPSLVTLDILFCYNLKAIFYDNGGHSPYQLQELPLLEHLRVGDDMVLTAPAWEELYVRGCWSLRHLPRLRQRPGKVKVSGERAWWAKLHWDDRDDDEAPPRHHSYEPRLPPAFASLRERVVIKTYLR
ncbi:disease resistance protein RPV1-like [Phragmites australis]|uniref:disease resistance protein RPV1-like n=1 Tax=Phragmites australis TaxID=29695 RepID=UPI002D79FD05|nr:disease resistance protein RPV1-like [Phragmites australis]